MADSIGSRILARIYKSVSGVDPDGRGHGPYPEANDGWVDSKPYVSHWRQGLFEGYDGSLWLYMGVPGGRADSVAPERLGEDRKSVILR